MYEITPEHANRVLAYMLQQRREFETVLFNPLDDSLLAYVKHDWNNAGLGSWNCQTVQGPLREILEKFTKEGLLERVESSYVLSEGL